MDRLILLRKLMAERGIDAYIIPSGDAHNSEYVADYWCARQWFSGFTGSSGTVVVTQKTAGLWTDGRYFIQAETELSNTGISLFKMGNPGVPTYQNFILAQLPNGGTIGFDGTSFPKSSFDELKKALNLDAYNFAYKEDLVDLLWELRPPLPTLPAFEHAPNFAGISAAQKLATVRERMQSSDVDAYIVTALDDIAWLLNIRGQDVQSTPLVYAFVLITASNADIFIDQTKVASFSSKLISQGFTLHSYESIAEKVKALPANSTVYFNPAKTNTLLAEAIPVDVLHKNDCGDIIANLKSIKSEAELKNIRNAYIKEGVAMVKLLKWLDDGITAGKTLTEDAVACQLQCFRKQQEHYICDGFNTISAYGANGAIVHYRHQGEGATLQAEGFYLLDTGSQYLDGTTDTTRTIAMGKLTDEMKRDFTLVLKGHIALSRAVFMDGTTGHALDMLARQPILQDCQNYNHGTGHGIGYCLGVHEGPQSIAHRHNPVTLQEGMLLSNEPGIYKQGRYGIRIENILAVQELCTNENGKFLNFETLTYCPYDLRAADMQLLSPSEVRYINTYHTKVYETLAPLLEPEEADWLLNATKAI